MMILEPTGIRMMLQLLMQSGTLVSVRQMDAQPVIARIAVLDDSGVVLLAGPTKEARSLNSHAQCSVEFEGPQGGMMFTCEIHTVKSVQSGSGTAIGVTFPREVVDRDRRQNARLTLMPEIPLSVNVQLFGEVMACRPIDVSHSGLKVALPKPDFGVMLDMTRIHIAADLCGVLYNGPGQIRWGQGEYAGILLPEMENVPPNDLSHPWVKILQRCIATQLAAALRVAV